MITRFQIRGIPLVFIFSLILIFLASSSIASTCHSSCHGHGICSKWNTCDCYEGWEGYDCARKSCPVGAAFVDIPSSSSFAHQNTQCSSQGTCDYNTGLCKCHSGYSGLNCGKSQCMNGCSGHGQCISLGTAAFDNDGYTLNRTSSYSLWDADRVFGCNCEYGWQGADCSQRVCEFGLDPRETSVNSKEIVTLVCACTSSESCLGRFKLRLFGKELRGFLSPSSTSGDFIGMVQAAIGIYQNSSSLSFPSIDSPNRRSNDTICAPLATVKTKIRFRRNYGDLPPLSIIGNTISRGTVYFETLQTIQCNCLNSPCNGTFRVSFDQEMSPRISSFDNGTSIVTALRAMKSINNSLFSVSASGYEPICVGKQSRNFTITFHGPAGNAPKLGLWSSIVNQKEPSVFRTNRTAGILSLFTNDGRDDNVKMCNGIGSCDFSSGLCQCPPGWGFDPDLGSCGAFQVTSSVWTGVGRCPGVIDVTQIGKRVKTVLDLKPNYEVQVYVSMNPVKSPGNLAAVYVFPWIAEQAQGAELDRGAGELVFNLTSDESAGPLALDSAAEQIFFIDNNPSDSFIGIARQFDNPSGTITKWYHFTYEIFGFALDAYLGRRKLYWSVPGGLGLDDGAIYWAYADSAASPTVNSLTATIGQKHLYNPRGIAIHYPRKRIYWVDRNGTGQHGVLRSVNLDGSGFRQDTLLTKIDNQTISMNLTDLVIHFKYNDTAFLIDSNPPGKMIAINLNAPISFNHSDALDPTLYEAYYSPRIINVTAPEGGLSSPLYLSLDERNQYLLWSEPALRQIKFSRYVHTIWNDIEGSGVAYNGHVQNPSDSQSSFEFSPVAMVFDRGLGPSRFGETSDCYGNGVCGGTSGAFVCACNDGFEGDCQTARCPLGRAWFNEPTVDNIAHDEFVECSNMGVCDRRAGLCVCKEGYEGSACERSSCSGDQSNGAVCYNKGKCRSMRELALSHSDDFLQPSPVYYGGIASSPSTWDADMVYGCLPDKYGWFEGEYNITSGSNLQSSEYFCPYGYNRRLSDKVYKKGNYANFTSEHEIQQIICSAYKGSFQFLFRGETTSPIDANVTSSRLKLILQKLPSIGPVQVTMSASQMCSDVQEFRTNITFLAQFGKVPLLQVVNSELRGFTNTVAVSSIQSGTADSFMECSGHGECDRSRGICKCWDGYGPSDGLGNVGNHPDCGYSFI